MSPAWASILCGALVTGPGQPPVVVIDPPAPASNAVIPDAITGAATVQEPDEDGPPFPGSASVPEPESAPATAEPGSQAPSRAASIAPSIDGQTAIASGAEETGRGGLLGWGIGLELPMVGVFGGVATMSNVGAGYTLGAAITYEVVTNVMLRLFATWGQTHRANAPVSFRLSGERQLEHQSGEWLTLDIGIGAAYLFREILRSVAPYAGLDVGITLIDGYELVFSSAMEDLVYDREQRRQFDAGRLFGQDVAFIGGVRGGIRLELDTWLASMVELRISYIHGGEDPILNALNGPDVRTVPEHIWLIRGTFSVWVGL